MTRIKVLSLALVAIFAMGVMTSSAMAAKISTNLANVNLQGEQPVGTNDVFSVDGSNVTCENATYNSNGAVANGATAANLHPSYANCTAFGFIGANVNTANCNYEGTVDTANATYNEANMTWNAAHIIIKCNVNPITINAGSGTCVATVGNTTNPTTIGGSTLHFGNTTNEPMDFHIQATNVVVPVQKNADNFGCPFNGTGATNGTYNGLATLRAHDPTNNALVGVTVVP
ncbi:MAG TPA: hypothetical protein VFI17_00980 [Solirubrobacterales bacterium]|nr:hypothetical protein [Solirubrobacterales bacterium]